MNSLQNLRGNFELIIIQGKSQIVVFLLTLKLNYTDRANKANHTMLATCVFSERFGEMQCKKEASNNFQLVFEYVEKIM